MASACPSGVGEETTCCGAYMTDDLDFLSSYFPPSFSCSHLSSLLLLPLHSYPTPLPLTPPPRPTRPLFFSPAPALRWDRLRLWHQAACSEDGGLPPVYSTMQVCPSILYSSPSQHPLLFTFPASSTLHFPSILQDSFDQLPANLIMSSFSRRMDRDLNQDPIS